jgi:hypothetical protein
LQKVSAATTTTATSSTKTSWLCANTSNTPSSIGLRLCSATKLTGKTASWSMKRENKRVRTWMWPTYFVKSIASKSPFSTCFRKTRNSVWPWWSRRVWTRREEIGLFSNITRLSCKGSQPQRSNNIRLLNRCCSSV